MRGILGWLLLLPLAFAFWLTITIARGCANKGGGLWRLLGVLASFVIGGVCGVVGYWLGPEEGLIFGWIVLVGGGLMAILGTWTALLGTKEEAQRTELEELARKQLTGERKLGKLDEEKWDDMWKSAKEEAKRILEQDKVDNYERFSLIRSTLAYHGNDDESFELYQRLKKLEWKSTKEEAKRILEQDEIDNYKKKEWQRLGIICYRLTNSHDPEAIELLKQLKELKYKKAKS